MMTAMSHALLSSWLEVPASPWPPLPHALLGLPAEGNQPADVERQVLARMERLRQQQLTHPDEATEGMNLIAQAMIALTEPQKLEPINATEFVFDDSAPLVELIDAPRALPAERPLIRAPLPVSLPLAAEPIEELYKVESEEADDALPARTMAVKRPADPHRAIYADLVRVRRALTIWERLRLFVEEPERTFTRRTDTVAFMTCLSDLLPTLPSAADLVGTGSQPGHLIAALARQQLVVEMFRSLLPDQREALARDCRQAHLTLRDYYDDRRAEIRTRTRRNFARRYWYPLLRELKMRPEWVLLGVGVTALSIALLRSLPR